MAASTGRFTFHCQYSKVKALLHSPKLGKHGFRPAFNSLRCFSLTRCLKEEGLVVGVYEPAEKGGAFILTPAAQDFNNETGGKLESILKVAGRKLSSGNSRVLYGLDGQFQSVAVANLGPQDAGVDAAEQVDVARETVRTAVASAVLGLRECGETKVSVDPCGFPDAAAEGGALSLFSYDELKHEDKRKPSVALKTFAGSSEPQSHTTDLWSRGIILAEGQNFARFLKEAPANRITPSRFCEEVKSSMSGLAGVNVTIRDQDWVEEKKMGAFLSVSRGSDEPLKFLEIDYTGGKEGDPPVILVGKGVTFDSGGISIKPSASMDKMRADMGGAAAVAGCMLATAKLGLGINVKALMPLCENMPSGNATKPGDVVTAMNGKTIQVDNTDAEGRLILADALCYAESFKPRLIIDLATLTGAIMVGLGEPVSGVFTTSQTIWQGLQQAGVHTGDRVWRMPLLKAYASSITKCDLADLNNIGSGREGGACTAAAFLWQFVKSDLWAHMDIAGVMMNQGTVPYLSKGMSGRPTRTLVQFLDNLSQQK